MKGILNHTCYHSIKYAGNYGVWNRNQRNKRDDANPGTPYNAITTGVKSIGHG